jgi:hypothetical protein
MLEGPYCHVGGVHGTVSSGQGLRASVAQRVRPEPRNWQNLLMTQPPMLNAPKNPPKSPDLVAASMGFESTPGSFKLHRSRR